MRVIVEPTQLEIRREANAKLVNLLSKAHEWFRQLTSGQAKPIQKIAPREDIDGIHPVTLTSDSLMRQIPLPVDWQEQQRVLGFNQG